MATLVQSKSSQSAATTSAALAFDSGVTAGSTLILVFTHYFDPDVTVTVSNSNGAALTLRTGPQRADIDDVAKWIFSLDSASAGATTLTVNIANTAASNAYTLEIFEVSWSGGSGGFVAAVQDEEASATVDPGNLTNTVAEAFIICSSTSYFSEPTAASGWTAVNPGNAHWYEFTQYRIVASATSWSTAMGGSVDAWAAVAAIFQAAGGGGGGPTRGTPFGNRSTAFNGGRTFHGIIQ